ncbi:MAG: multi-sensor hybrid histidine [Desulfobulbaceae bacterium]|nr:MAG: multi-sensor hybrid histidine [Desulfobulbaceae bacterium]
MATLTGKVLLNIRKILRERNAFQQELKQTNEGLEQTILERTWKLHEEVEERKKAEEKEHQHALFLKTIINSLAHPFYVVDVETYEIKMLNDAARQLNPEHSRFCYTLTHHKDDPCNGKDHPCPLAEVKRSGQSVTIEHIHYNQAGEKIYVEVHGYPVFDADGNVIQMIEYNIDITDRKLAEMALTESHKNLEATVKERTANLEEEIEKRQKIQAYFQESEHYYRTLIESSNDLITIIDGSGTITYASPSIRRMLGYSPEFIEGKNLYDYLHHDDIRFGKDQFSAFLASLVPEKRLEHRILASDGRYLVMDSSFHNLFHDKAINGLLLTARDITAKREADALMRKLQLVIEQSPNSVVITNKDGAIEYVNPQFELVTGYTKAEALTQNPRMLNSGLTSPETFQSMWNTISQGKIWQGEFANRNKMGKIYYENVVIAPLKNELNEVTHYVAMKENITELKLAREQAEASNKAKSEFLSRMSHELRTPLNAINGFSKLLMGSKTSQLTPRQQEQVLQINTAGHYLLALINEILDLSRIESGKLTLSIKSIQPAEEINNCLALVESLAVNNKVSIHIDDTIRELPAIKADPTRFQQVMLNLLSNAIKYNRPDGTVTITGAVEEKMACIRVIDTGIGIAPDKQKELFVPFTRLGQDDTTVEGTGIGMTITKQLIELMQGVIDFTSIPGSGSTFRVALPLADHEDQVIMNADLKIEQIDLASKAATILYIEDNSDDISRMRKLMVHWPHASLVIRKTPEKGVQTVEMLNPNFIILSLDLFGADAANTIFNLQQDPQTRNIPIVALGGEALPDTANGQQDAFHKLGCYEYFTKPMDVSKLHTILTTVLKEKRNDREQFDGKPFAG